MKLTKKRYLAAVSGGPDSMALLHRYHKKIFAVCHVNYHKRVDSDYDTNIVKEYCQRYNIKLLIYDVNKTVYKKNNIHNFQTLARQIRYDFFIKCGNKLNCHDLLIAHNLNDFLETAYMQEKRHSQNFFYGIKSITKYKNLNIYRPLIHKFKSDLEKYCKSHHIAYAIDSTNASNLYERNRVRKVLSKWSKRDLIKKYLHVYWRNKRYARLEKKIKKHLIAWQKTNYSVNYFVSINPKYLDSVVYLYLKNNKIIHINYNKIKLVRDYIVSKKSNNSLRLEDKILLFKQDGKVRIKLGGKHG